MIEINKAPAGGAVSPVNGQFYDGGEFMPVTGLSCGLARRARKAAALAGNLAELVIGYRGTIAARVAGAARVQYVQSAAITRAEALAVAGEIVRLRAEQSRGAGLQPHPTKITDNFSE